MKSENDVLVYVHALCRYINKQYVEQVHWQSEPFKTFQRGCEEAGIQWLERNVTTYEEQDIGF